MSGIIGERKKILHSTMGCGKSRTQQIAEAAHSNPEVQLASDFCRGKNYKGAKKNHKSRLSNQKVQKDGSKLSDDSSETIFGLRMAKFMKHHEEQAQLHPTMEERTNSVTSGGNPLSGGVGSLMGSLSEGESHINTKIDVWCPEEEVECLPIFKLIERATATKLAEWANIAAGRRAARTCSRSNRILVCRWIEQIGKDVTPDQQLLPLAPTVDIATGKQALTERDLHLHALLLPRLVQRLHRGNRSASASGDGDGNVGLYMQLEEEERLLEEGGCDDVASSAFSNDSQDSSSKIVRRYFA